MQKLRGYICRVMAVTAMLAFLGMLTGCRPYLKGPMGSESRPLLLRLKKMYLAPSAPPLQAAAAAWGLRQAGLPAAFWANVANTAPRGTVRFRVAVLVLFADYLRKGMTLGQFSKVLGGAAWLRSTDASSESVKIITSRRRHGARYRLVSGLVLRGGHGGVTTIFGG